MAGSGCSGGSEGKPRDEASGYRISGLTFLANSIEKKVSSFDFLLSKSLRISEYLLPFIIIRGAVEDS